MVTTSLKLAFGFSGLQKTFGCGPIRYFFGRMITIKRLSRVHGGKWGFDPLRFLEDLLQIKIVCCDQGWRSGPGSRARGQSGGQLNLS